MNKEAKMLQLKTNKGHKNEQKNSQLDILSIYYHELLKIEELIPEYMKLELSETYKV